MNRFLIFTTFFTLNLYASSPNQENNRLFKCHSTNDLNTSFVFSVDENTENGTLLARFYSHSYRELKLLNTYAIQMQKYGSSLLFHGKSFRLAIGEELKGTFNLVHEKRNYHGIINCK